MLPDVVCSLLTIDDTGHLRPLAAPGLPDSYSAALDGLAIGPDVGSCGSAAYLGQSVTVTDIEHDPRWAAFRALALPLGLRACWSSPILGARGRVLGTFAFYYKECRGPSEIERKLVETSVNLCAIAIERRDRVVERERLASIDGLTDLANRGSFNRAIAELRCGAAVPWALLMIDLDNLKVVNDTFGHQAGDALIKDVARRIEDTCRPDRVFRIGGDEFAVIIEAEDRLVDIEVLAQDILFSLETLADCNRHLIKPQATIGGAVMSDRDSLPDTVRQNADFALYHAKETRRGGFVRYWPGLGTAMTNRLSVIREVETALREARVRPFYQPIVRLDTREIVGAEALCRIIAKDGSVIPAGLFHQATSDAHIASELTEVMLGQLARDLHQWRDMGIVLPHVSFNVSSADFHLGRLHQQIARAFEGRDIPRDQLIVEVTEGVYLGKRDDVIAREIERLRTSGLRVALDDFGTGFASLTHLLTVPVDIIKIDKSFIERLAPADPSSVILEGIFQIAQKLGITAIAEGIETEEQAAHLTKFGCAFGQGFLVSSAVDFDTLTRMVLSGPGHGIAAAA